MDGFTGSILRMKPGESCHAELIPDQDLQTEPDVPVLRFPFRSNAFYYTHDMWLDGRTLLFETQVDPHPSTLYYKSCVLKACFNEAYTECEVTMLVPPSAAAWSMQSCLSHDKRTIILPREATIERLDVQTLARDVLVHLPRENQNYGVSGLALTCNDRMLYFVTWHHDAALQPNGRVYRADVNTAKTEYLADVPYPGVWTHFLASPTNPDILSFAYIEEMRYPEFREARDRLRLMHLGQTKPGAVVTSVLYHNNPAGIPWNRELVTHECWGKNGEFLTFIVRRDKIKRIFIDTKKVETVFKGGSRGPKPWHCEGANGRYYVFDTMNPNTGIWIGKFGEKGAHKICHAADVTTRIQPHHPHPFFSPDVSHVVFNSIAGDDAYLHIVPVHL